MPGMERLPAAVDDPGLDQVDRRVGKYLRVDAEVLLVFQVGEQSVRNAAVPDLDGRTVFDQVGDVLGDSPRDLGFARSNEFVDRSIILDHRIDLADMDESVTERAGHLRVDLGDDMTGRISRRLGYVHRHAEAAEAVLIRRCDVNQGDIERDAAGAEQLRNLREENRCVVGAAFPDRRADVGADEERVGTVAAGEFLLGIGRDAQGQQVSDFDIFYRAVGKRLHQLLGRAAGRADEQPVARLQDAQRFVGGFDLVTILLAPVNVTHKLLLMLQRRGFAFHSASGLKNGLPFSSSMTPQAKSGSCSRNDSHFPAMAC